MLVLSKNINKSQYTSAIPLKFIKLNNINKTIFLMILIIIIIDFIREYIINYFIKMI